MKNVHLVIPDLFLPREIAAEACAGLRLPALETLLARAQPEGLQGGTLEEWLCTTFGVADQAIAPVTLIADGMEPGAAYWLRADPVHVFLQRDQLILQTDAILSGDEAAQLCASLNEHFAAAGLQFFAPHPQRWYLKLDQAPDMTTHPVSQAAGGSVQAHLPQGADALHWHGVFNEIQMLLFEHPVNQAREARGEPPANSVWLWGGGRATGKLARPFARMYCDSDLAAAFARAAGMPCDSGSVLSAAEGDLLMVLEHFHRAIRYGDLHAWRSSLQRFEEDSVQPLLAALRAGRIGCITLDVLGASTARRFVLTRGMAWKLWRRPHPITQYSNAGR